MLDPTDGPQTVTLDQHCDRLHKQGPICAQRFEECPFLSTKTMVTRSAVIPTFTLAIDFDVARPCFSKSGTRLLIAPLSVRFHRASPRFGRCANHTPKTGFPGLGVQHRNMNPKVFVSHASEDKNRFVLSFAKRLREKGIDAWLDRWEMAPGDSLVRKIFEEGLKEANAVIVVVSQYRFMTFS